jgi:hypothetical protein
MEKEIAPGVPEDENSGLDLCKCSGWEALHDGGRGKKSF